MFPCPPVARPLGLLRSLYIGQSCVAPFVSICIQMRPNVRPPSPCAPVCPCNHCVRMRLCARDCACASVWPAVCHPAGSFVCTAARGTLPYKMARCMCICQGGPGQGILGLGQQTQKGTDKPRHLHTSIPAYRHAQTYINTHRHTGRQTGRQKQSDSRTYKRTCTQAHTDIHTHKRQLTDHNTCKHPYRQTYGRTAKQAYIHSQRERQAKVRGALSKCGTQDEGCSALAILVIT